MLAICHTLIRATVYSYTDIIIICFALNGGNNFSGILAYIRYD